MTNDIRFDVEGKSTLGALALPVGNAPAGAVIVVHEWFGLNDEIRRQADRFAGEGFVALAVDLFDGQVAADDGGAMKLAQAMRTADALKTIAAAKRHVEGHARSNGKTAITGFCLGGGMALASALGVPGFAGAVPFYGTPRDEFLRYDDVRCPILGHYAKNDSFVNADRVRGIAEKVNAAGGSFELHFYEGGHAFMRAGSEKYHEESAKLAWPRTVTFLRKHLA